MLAILSTLSFRRRPAVRPDPAPPAPADTPWLTRRRWVCVRCWADCDLFEVNTPGAARLRVLAELGADAGRVMMHRCARAGA